MKKIKMIAGLWLAATALFTYSLHAQTSRPLQGRVLETNVTTPLAGATIKTASGATVTDENGYFSLRIPGGTDAEVSATGFQPWKGKLYPDSANIIRLIRTHTLMQPVEIRAVRAAENAPFTKTTLSAAALEKLNLGQDIPFLLNQTPSVVIHSDAGNGVGYTGLRIRGTDPTRINMTINGIPYNDAESQGIFFVNLPDLASSLNSVQIQRGVGTSRAPTSLRFRPVSTASCT
jgi:iron complex outermembrane receptor protein